MTKLLLSDDVIFDCESENGKCQFVGDQTFYDLKAEVVLKSCSPQCHLFYNSTETDPQMISAARLAGH